ncbi:MAG TPA: amidase [Casimicrobiaceae bacterium]|nr:amidase [Casimicrobiaceae bacterium]
MSAPTWALSAVELARAFAARALDPVDVLEAVTDRIARIDPQINALVTADPTARMHADASARRHAAGTPLGPLDGVPVAIKDNLLVRGLAATWGTRGLAAYVPDHDELPVARLRAAGAVIVGKTNAPEFTLEGYTGNPVFGVTRNPWDVRLTPGGSSGGSAAGCAAGLFPLALCTDGGGSIRRPASHTGLVGFKPSIGAVPRANGFPSLLLDFEVVGPLARSVDDAALLFDAIRGPDALDRASLAAMPAKADTRTMSILAVPRFGDAPLDPEVAASFDDAVRTLATLGHRVDVGALPLDLEPILAFWPIVGQVSLARLFAAWPGIGEHASVKYVEMASHGERISAARFLEGLEAVAAFRRATTTLFEGVDVVLTPAAAALPWPADEAFPPTIDGRPVGPRGHAVYTGWVNVCGHPAIAVPSTPSRAGLPIGVQMVGAFGADLALIELARAYERAGPWAARRPPL